MIRDQSGASWRGRARGTPGLLLLQPLLARVVRNVMRRDPALFARLGTHKGSRFLIAPRGLPFLLYLRPDPCDPVLRALPRHARPAHDAYIAAGFFQLLRMIDGAEDGDAMFFSRDLDIRGDTEAVVSLRNAIDSLDRPLAATVADTFGAPGRAVLSLLRQRTCGR